MPISNTTNQVTPMLLERARSFALRLSFMLADDTVVDLTGGTITFTMLQPPRQGNAVVLTKNAVLVSPEIGYAVLDLQAAELDLEPATYPYSITYVDADAYSSTVVKGEVQILGNTDPLTANLYDVLSLDVELGFSNIVVTVNHLRPPEITVGAVVTLPYGTPAGASFRGGYPHHILDLSIPHGPPSGDDAAIYDLAFDTAVAAAAADATAKDAVVSANAAADATAKANAAEADAIAAAAAGLAAHEADTSTHGVATVAGVTEAQAFQNKDLSHASNIFPASLATDAEVADVNNSLFAHGLDTSTHGVGEIVGADEVQALTNKDLSDSSNIFPAAPDVQIFTASGTWNKPAGAKYVEIEVLGGGGGGGGATAAAASQHSCGTGGGAGGYAWAKKAAADLTASVAVTVGAAGLGQAGAVGTAGGSSSFGAYVVAGGGAGGLFTATNANDFWVEPPAGGTATVGDLLIPGQGGGAANGDNVFGMGGRGGDSKYGAGGRERGTGASAQALSGYAATGYGAGGGGALETGATAVTRNGGNGSPGIVIVRTYFV